MFWNADGQGLTAQLALEMTEMSLANSLIRPGGVSALGEPDRLVRYSRSTPITSPVAPTTSRRGRRATPQPGSLGGENDLCAHADRSCSVDHLSAGQAQRGVSSPILTSSRTPTRGWRLPPSMMIPGGHTGSTGCLPAATELARPRRCREKRGTSPSCPAPGTLRLRGVSPDGPHVDDGCRLSL